MDNQEIIKQHDIQHHPDGSGYKVYGYKKDKIKGIYCKLCKIFITPIILRPKGV